MSCKEFEQLLPILEAIHDEEVKNPHIPVAAELQEAENLYQWCQADKVALTRSGLDWSVVASLPVRIAACTQAERVWQNHYRSRKERNQCLKERIREGFGLRTRLLHFFDFAFRDDPQWKRISRSIRNDRKIVAMIQHLSDLSAIGKEKKELLEKINVDAGLLDLAAQKSEELAGLYAQRTRDMAEQDRLKDLRNRAYTYLAQAVKTIRVHGRFVFRYLPDRRKGYVSHYRKLH
ncbi:hypothetical protein ACT29H_12400 [Thermophagus sp. OGC60D27]|uniref:hypothetical protein n=1 Tax=Thermophagus sp. OGC60D27 TaxID=3458415 RepID=UPI00403832A2